MAISFLIGTITDNDNDNKNDDDGDEQTVAILKGWLSSFSPTHSFLGHDGAHPRAGRLPQDARLRVHLDGLVLVSVAIVDGWAVICA